MAEITDELWKYNLAKVVILDVTDDYELMQPPLPNSCYPVLRETYLPIYQLQGRVDDLSLVEGFLYDWHQSPDASDPAWYFGMVDEQLAKRLLGQA
jgi:hypothetical protein